MKWLWHTWRMSLVWDILHASMNSEGGQLTWCCITRECGRGSQLSVPEEEFNEDLFFFFWILNFENLNFSKELKFFIFLFFLKNLEILNFFKELKILIDDFFFESNLRSTSPMPLVPRPFLKNFLLFFFENFWNLEFFHGIEIFDWWFFFFEKFRNLEFFQGIENFEFFFFFERNLRSTSLMPLVPRPFLKFFFFFFWRFVHYQKKVKKMKMMME